MFKYMKKFTTFPYMEIPYITQEYLLVYSTVCHLVICINAKIVIL